MFSSITFWAYLLLILKRKILQSTQLNQQQMKMETFGRKQFFF